MKWMVWLAVLFANTNPVVALTVDCQGRQAAWNLDFTVQVDTKDGFIAFTWWDGLSPNQKQKIASSDLHFAFDRDVYAFSANEQGALLTLEVNRTSGFGIAHNDYWGGWAWADCQIAGRSTN